MIDISEIMMWKDTYDFALQTDLTLKYQHFQFL